MGAKGGFQPGEGPSRGLLCDCKTSLNLRQPWFEAVPRTGGWCAGTWRPGGWRPRTGHTATPASSAPGQPDNNRWRKCTRKRLCSAKCRWSLILQRIVITHFYRPFYWSLGEMVSQLQMGLRQHHCRRCGAAVCDYCSSNRSVLADRGHEVPVR